LAEAQPPRSHLEAGSVFAGYRIEGVFERGGMGVVYRAVDPDLDREIALKIIAPEHTQNATAVARFKAECRLAASIEHPNIVPIHRGGESDGRLYLAMRFVPGTNLRKIIDRGPMDLPRVASIISQVGAALDAAHDAGLVHRDVKPANVLITGPPDKPQVYLTDFGLTKQLGSVVEGEALTRDGGWVGTPDYVAPEQIQGHKVDRRADVYSLGCMLFEMLTGHVAYEKDSDMAKLWAHVTDPPPLPRTIRPDLPGAFDDIVARATAKEPGHRYATAGALAAVVSDIVALQESERRWSANAASSSASAASAAPIIDDDLELTREERIMPEAVTPPPPPPPPPSRPRPPRVAAGAGAGAGAGAVAPADTVPPDGGAPPRTPRRRGGASDGGGAGRRVKPLAGLALLIGAAVAAIVVLGGGSDKPEKPKVVGQPIDGKLAAVPTNRVKGNGTATLRLNGSRLTVSVDSAGLLDGAPHALHIHAGAKGTCPTASIASLHNGHLSIATHQGGPFYGPPVLAMTKSGDTTPEKSLLAFSRYPNTANVAYERTMTVTPIVASYLRKNNAVVVVHGIDYNSNGVYDGVLERSDIDRSLTGESTAPALCGPLKAGKAPPADGKTASSGTQVFTASLQLSSGSSDPPGPPPLVCPIHPGFRQA
jgi:serine/threonine protein kinase